MIKVSVLIPIYNVGPFLKEALSSIVNQTFKNLEIIIVDDCSTDNSLGIANEFRNNDNRIIVLENSRNHGIVYSLNRAFAYSTGNFICRMDGDDVSELDRIEKKLEFLLSNNLDLVGCSVVSISQEGNFIKKKFMSNNLNFIKYSLKHKSPILHIWLSRREVYEKLKSYRNIPYCEDYDFILRARKQKFKIANMSNYFGYKIRLREGNTFSTNFFIQRHFHNYVYLIYKNKKNSYLQSFELNTKKLKVKVGKFDKFLLKLFQKIKTKKYNILFLFQITFIFLFSSAIRRYLIDTFIVNFYSIIFGAF